MLIFFIYLRFKPKSLHMKNLKKLDKECLKSINGGTSTECATYCKPDEVCIPGVCGSPPKCLATS